MTEKRFVNEDDCCGYYTEIIDNEKELDLSLSNPKKNLTIEELVDLLNDLNDENEELKKDYDYLEKRFKEEEWHYDHIDEDRDVWMYKCHKLEKENEKLKQLLLQFYTENEINAEMI